MNPPLSFFFILLLVFSYIHMSANPYIQRIKKETKFLRFSRNIRAYRHSFDNIY